LHLVQSLTRHEATQSIIASWWFFKIYLPVLLR
jgi:hypothetical protein